MTVGGVGYISVAVGLCEWAWKSMGATLGVGGYLSVAVGVTERAWKSMGVGAGAGVSLEGHPVYGGPNSTVYPL